jgi:murein DD-endopeptidase MepM/ murein hydrolase activator NlpD
MLLGLFASAVTGTTLYLVLRRDEDTGSTETDYVDPNAPRLAPGATGALAPPLAPPLALPLRKTTPHGQFGAARPAGSTNPDHAHQGVDLVGRAGEPVLAVGNGVIVDSKPGIGQTVRVLLLDDGRAVVYADLGEANVEPGKRVRTGDVVGTMRQNGFVHVGIRESRMGKFMNPAGVIPFAG